MVQLVNNVQKIQYFLNDVILVLLWGSFDSRLSDKICNVPL